MAAASTARAVSRPSAFAPGLASGPAWDRAWNDAPAGPNICIDRSMYIIGLSGRVRYTLDPLFLRTLAG